MRNRFCWLSALMLAGCFVVAAAEPPAQKLLPKDTILVVTVPDLGKAAAMLTNSSIGRLWNDPSVKAFKDKFNNKFENTAVGPLERQLGIQFSDYAGLAQGQVTFAIVPAADPGKPDDRYAAVFILDSGSHAAQLTTNLAALKKKWIDAGKSLKTEKIRETEFTTFIMSSSDVSLQKLLPGVTDTNDAVDEALKPEATKMEFTVGQSGNLLLVSQSPQVIEKIMTRQSGGLLSGLDEQPTFQTDYGARLQNSPAYVWFNAKGVIGDMLKAMNDGAAAAPAGPINPQAALEALGLNGLNSVSMSYRDNPDGMGFQIFIGAPEATRRGLLKALVTESKDSGPPPFVPADTVKFSRLRLDIPKSWRALEAAANSINPGIGQMLNYALDVAGKAKDEKYDLRAELLDNLGDDIITYSRAPAAMTVGDLREPPSLVLIGSPSPGKLVSALKVLMNLFAPADKVTDREFLGRKIYDVPLPFSPGGGSHSYHFAASGSYVAISGDVQMLEEYLRSGDNDKPGLDKTPGLREAAQKAGGGLSTGIFAFSNDKEDMRVLLETVRKESVSGTDLLGLFGTQLGMNKMSTVEEANQFKEWVDFSLLPAPATLTKYFNYTVWVGGATPEGFVLNCFTPATPK